MKMFNYVENFLQKSTIVVCMRPLSFVVIEEPSLDLDLSSLASYSRYKYNARAIVLWTLNTGWRSVNVNLWLNTNAVTYNKFLLIKKLVLKNRTMNKKCADARTYF